MHNLSCGNEFYLHENENHFHVIGWALNLVLIQRPRGTRKWPIKAYSPLTRLSLGGVGVGWERLSLALQFAFWGVGHDLVGIHNQGRSSVSPKILSMNWKMNPLVVPVKSIKFKLIFLHTKWAVNILRELKLVSHGDGSENHRHPKLYGRLNVNFIRECLGINNIRPNLSLSQRFENSWLTLFLCSVQEPLQSGSRPVFSVLDFELY